MSAILCAATARSRGSSVPEVDDAAWRRLHRLADAFATLCASAPAPADATARSRWLLGLRRELAARGHRAPLIGAAGFQRAHPIAKARADLTGLLYADGIHDSLYRSGGVSLLAEPVAPAVPIRVDVTAADRYGKAA